VLGIAHFLPVDVIILTNSGKPYLLIIGLIGSTYRNGLYDCRSRFQIVINSFWAFTVDNSKIKSPAKSFFNAIWSVLGLFLNEF